MPRYTLDGKERSRLREAILAGFDPDSLNSILRDNNRLQHNIALGPDFITRVNSLVDIADQEGWLDDLEKAKAQAKAENKKILLDFTGSDWCGWCIKLQKEVFTKDGFKQEAPKHFVLLEVDFPQQKELPKELKEQNEKLQETYSVEAVNADLRHYLKRLARRSRCFSRRMQSLAKNIQLFVYCYNHRQLANRRFPKYSFHLIDFLSLPV